MDLHDLSNVVVRVFTYVKLHMFSSRRLVSIVYLIIKGGCMKQIATTLAVIIAFALSTLQGVCQVESKQELINEERGSPWASHTMQVEQVPLTTGKQISLVAEYSIRTSAGVCEVFLDRVMVDDRSMIQGAILGETFYRHIYTAIARNHAGTGLYPYASELTAEVATKPTHVFTRGMMMSWITPKGSRSVSIEPHPTSALCASSYAFRQSDAGVQATSFGITYNVKHTPETSVSEVR
jgi:hypothetical protein